jgi:hypothetical protein
MGVAVSRGQRLDETDGATARADERNASSAHGVEAKEFRIGAQRQAASGLTV